MTIITYRTSLILLSFFFFHSLFAIDYSLLGQPAPEFELSELTSAKKIKLSDYKGKVVLINFWASWCAPCRAELPTLVKLQKKYNDKNFVILGVAVEDKPFVDKFLEVNNITLNYPVTAGKIEASQILGQYGNPDELLPYSVLISPKQDILSIYPGILGEAKMERVLGRLFDNF